MKKAIPLFIISLLAFAICALGEDFTTLLGRTYSNVEVIRIDPDGITVKHSAGLTKLFFRELPEDIRARYGADPAKAAEYQRARAAAQAQRDAEYVKNITTIRQEQADSLQEIETKEKAAAAEKKRTEDEQASRAKALRQASEYHGKSFGWGIDMGGH